MKKVVRDQKFRDEYAQDLKYKRVTLGIGTVLMLAWVLASYQFKGWPVRLLQVLVGAYFIAYTVNDARFNFEKLDNLGRFRCILGVVLGIILIAHAVIFMVMSV
ncbi:hypothetical protein [Atopobium fossor]|uniref:hypothetical protein n=1 Tax=Atopobium fossor TaxID=39487 RepID=UPI000405264A|nr:hypothetical protein [Atopobium fossor]